MARIFLALVLAVMAQAGWAKGLTGTFPSIDGGTLSIEDWRGQPVLVVNTASQCGFTYQYDGLQALYDAYRDAGLVVLAVPSHDFNQELASAEEVQEFCEINFDLDLPMTGITHVRGGQAHAFYQAVRKDTGFVPKWNFNKVLLSPEGEVVGAWGSAVKPNAPAITQQIEYYLN